MKMSGKDMLVLLFICSSGLAILSKANPILLQSQRIKFNDLKPNTRRTLNKTIRLTSEDKGQNDRELRGHKFLINSHSSK